MIEPRVRSSCVATSTGTTTHYVGGKAYENINRAGSIERKHYLAGGAVFTDYQTAGITKTRYLHKDHLGSIDAITDEAGIVVERMSFDAFGKRRDVDWVPVNDPTGYPALATTRGYTGHEQIDQVGLVHMNGRDYDAEIGRFLSADIVIQDATNLQSWNAYTYVLNNPLSYTDPTGFFFNKIFNAIGSAINSAFEGIGSAFKSINLLPIFLAAVKVVACTPFGPAAAACFALASAGQTLAMGGAIEDALISGAVSFFTQGVDSGLNLWNHVGEALQGIKDAGQDMLFAVVKPAAHGAISGALSVIQGGEFAHGFAGGAVGAAAGIASGGIFTADDVQSALGRTAIAAVAGGTGSAIAGGEFANGAITAAFAHMHNAERNNVPYIRPRGTVIPGSPEKREFTRQTLGAIKIVYNKIQSL